MTTTQTHYIAAGGNRHPSAADWHGDQLVYGSGNNIAIWNPETSPQTGVTTLLSGHTDSVNALKLLSLPATIRPLIISAAADKTVRLWSFVNGRYEQSACLTDHQASVNTISVTGSSNVFVTGAADATLKVWQIGQGDSSRLAEGGSIPGGQEHAKIEVQLLQSISLKPRFFPLTSAFTCLDDGSLVIAVAGTTANIQIYVQKGDQFSLAATLPGHEGWIRSLDFVRETNDTGSDILLASASQDKYIRLWRVHKGAELPAISIAANDPALGAFGKSLSNKPHYIGEGSSKHSITFEALLIGHEDWIYTAKWYLADTPAAQSRLLSASADNSLAIWERETESGYWTCITRLGEISTQKGSTSATGSTGGFWVGLWGPNGNLITSLGRTGSWRVWKQQAGSDSWLQQIGISGHVKEVKDIAWSRDGAYLLSTGSDQTTRLYSQQVTTDHWSWHEISRPQIHGYDLNCIDTLGTNQFISGADEKLLRVFNKPRAVANVISKLRNESEDTNSDLPDAANIPMLGLSNKAVTAADSEQEAVEATADVSANDRDAVDPASAISRLTLDLTQPPFEDQLARHTLWPEHEKLYGHGYEISAVAASNDGSLVATACRASSVDHAVVRLYETKDWRELRPSLTAHSLTVTSMAFSPDDAYLLTVGRDRQWAVFSREEPGSSTFKSLISNPKGHSRMILSCSWAPASAGYVFATAGRDKTVKIWHKNPNEDMFECRATVSTPASATAVAFNPLTGADRQVTLACGSEDGAISIVTLDTTSWATLENVAIALHSAPSAGLNALRWRPVLEADNAQLLASASDDNSVRLYRVAAS